MRNHIGLWSIITWNSWKFISMDTVLWSDTFHKDVVNELCVVLETFQTRLWGKKGEKFQEYLRYGIPLSWAENITGWLIIMSRNNKNDFELFECTLYFFKFRNNEIARFKVIYCWMTTIIVFHAFALFVGVRWGY